MNRHWILLLAAGCALAQPPRISNAQLQTRAISGSLESEFQALVAAQTAPAWIGYAVPMIEGRHNMCCYSDRGACACGLEAGRTIQGTAAPQGPVKLEGSRDLLVLYRVDQKRVDKVRTFSGDCDLDAGGLPFIWLTGVRPADSVALLESLISESEGRKDSVVAAIAFHAGDEAWQRLVKFTAADRPEWLREKTSFWLGVARGRQGYEVLRNMVRQDPSDRVREKVIFALSQSKEPAALDTMIDTARNDRSSRVRGQALFWLAQKAGQKAAGAITEAIERDPETEVKKRAVFALSQLPKDEGVPLLIKVARTNSNPVVRKQAVFWLGQSNDPRALDFFEQVLKD